MKTYLVTLKIQRNPDHDPFNKITGECPISTGKTCTDVTGQHHTVIIPDTHLTPAELAAMFQEKGCPVTRIEEV